ncbi:MAG: hypothetical protein HY899_06220 [Deltaproteobacteria bacterium]|nr:hypothetical protein [Deltaproteobacteria bacterium]
MDELKRQRPPQQADQDAIPERTGAPISNTGGTPGGPSPSALAQGSEGVELGGYGSLRFEGGSPDDVSDTFTFRRFVLTADAPVASRIRSSFELEFERFRKLELERSASVEDGGLSIEQEVDGTSDSEITMEQMWVEYDLDAALALRAGGVLVPLGRFNQNHNDERWDIARRPLIDRGSPVLPAPAAWAELGVGGLGTFEVGEKGTLEYQLYVVNGVTLDPSVEEKLATRDPSRDKLELEGSFKTKSGTFGNDVKDAKAVAGRLAYSPWLGSEIAGSFYYGRYTPDYMPNEAIAAFALDGIATFGDLELEGEYAFSDFGDVDRVAGGFARVVGEHSSAIPGASSPDFEAEIEFELASLAERRQGYWLEGRYDLRPAWLTGSVFGRGFADPRLTLVARAEQVWIDGLIDSLDFSGGAITSLTDTDHRLDRWTIGAAYRPVPNAALQLAYEYTQVDRGSLERVTNFMATNEDHAHTVLLGTVFGF